MPLPLAAVAIPAIAGIAKGLLSKGGPSAPDLTQLFNTINKAGAKERDLINALPIELQKQYADYKASNEAAGTNLQTGVSELGKNLLTQTEANYGPNAEAVRAAQDAAKTAIYADLPGQQEAIRQALAATGGFDRGTAAKQLAAPVLQAGQQYGQQVANITAQQLQAKQNATQNAIQAVTSMNDQALQQLFGMNTQQALQILQGNRQDLKDQLTSLINQSANQTTQTLGVQGANIQNQYTKALSDTAESNAKMGAVVGGGASLLGGFLGGLNTPQTTAGPSAATLDFVRR